MKRILTCISIIGIGFGITLILVFGSGSGSDGQNTSVVDNTETQQKPLPQQMQDTSKNRQEKVSHDKGRERKTLPKMQMTKNAKPGGRCKKNVLQNLKRNQKN